LGFRGWVLQLLYRNAQRFRGGLAFKAHRLLYHSAPGLRVIKKKKQKVGLYDALARPPLHPPPRRGRTPFGRLLQGVRFRA